MIRNLLATLILLFAAEWGMALDIERLSGAEVKTPVPALIVIHDQWGLDSFIKREVEKYAELGFVVVGVDLYGGQLPKDLPSAQRLRNNLDSEDAYAKIGKAFEKLLRGKRIDKTRVGVLGYGMGGGLALRYVLINSRLRSVVSIYGDPIVEDAAFKKLKVNRGLAIFASDDANIPPGKIDRFKKALKENHLLFDVEVIKSSRPGFFDSTRTADFNPSASDEARTLINSFLQKHLSLTEHRK